MKKNLLVIGILLLSMQNISAMRQFSGRIRNHALDMRQRFLVGQLRHQQQQRYIASITQSGKCSTTALCRAQQVKSKSKKPIVTHEDLTTSG